MHLELGLQQTHCPFEDKPFAVLKRQMYNICVIELLEVVVRLEDNSYPLWIVPLLRQLLLTDDRKIRGLVSDLYKNLPLLKGLE